MSERRANRLSFDFLVLGLALSIIFILFKIFFDENIAVSPFVLFGIIFFSTISNSFIPDRASDGVFSLRFFARLGMCSIFSAFLILIPVIARSVT